MLSLFFGHFAGTYKGDIGSFSVQFGLFLMLNKCYVFLFAVLLGVTKVIWISSLCALGMLSLFFGRFVGTYKGDMGSFSV